MYGRNIRARSARDLSVRWWNAHPRIVCRIAFSLRARRRQEGGAIATAAPGCLSRPKAIAEEVKRLDRIVAAPVRVLAVDDLRLCQMENQPAGPKTDLQ